MVAIHLTGHITDEGKLEVDLPQGLPAGEVQIVIELLPESATQPPAPWTDDELKTLLQIEPKSGAEIVKELEANGGWEDQDIASGADWVKNQRRIHERKFPEW